MLFIYTYTDFLLYIRFILHSSQNIKVCSSHTPRIISKIHSFIRAEFNHLCSHTEIFQQRFSSSPNISISFSAASSLFSASHSAITRRRASRIPMHVYIYIEREREARAKEEGPRQGKPVIEKERERETLAARERERS